jgi:hypothetical protein
MPRKPARSGTARRGFSETPAGYGGPVMQEGVSAKTVECFTHGLAHLIAELGYERGLAVAGRILGDLAETPRSELFETEAALAVSDGAKT